MDSSLPLSAAAYRPPFPPIHAPSPLQALPAAAWSSPSFPMTTPTIDAGPVDAYLDLSSAADLPPFSSYLDATTAAAAMPPHSSYAGDNSTSKGCAACRFRHQRCKDDCLFAPFFPASEDSKFQKAHRLFGVSSMQKILEPLLPDQRAVSMATMIYESEVRAALPATGCIDIILQLHSQIEHKMAHLALLRQHVAVVAPPAPSLDIVCTTDSEIIPQPLQSNEYTNFPTENIPPSPIATSNHKRHSEDLPEEEMMRRRSRRRISL